MVVTAWLLIKMKSAKIKGGHGPGKSFGCGGVSWVCRSKCWNFRSALFNVQFKADVNAFESKDDIEEIHLQPAQQEVASMNDEPEDEWEQTETASYPWDTVNSANWYTQEQCSKPNQSTYGHINAIYSAELVFSVLWTLYTYPTKTKV